MRFESSCLKFSIAVLIITSLSFCDGGFSKPYYMTIASSESYEKLFPWTKNVAFDLYELNIFTPHCSLDRVGVKECKTRIGERVLNCIVKCENVDAISTTICAFHYVDLTTSKNDCFNDAYTTKFPTPINLTNIAMMINENDSFLFNWLDIKIIMGVLEDTSYLTNKTGYELPFFSVVNNLHNLNKTLPLSVSNNILESINKFLIDLAIEDKPLLLNMPNIATEIIIKPNISNSNDHYNITLDGALVKIPNEILNTSILMIFKTNFLFSYHGGDINSKIINLIIIGAHEPLNKPISIYLKANSSIQNVCKIFNRYRSLRDVKTIILDDDLIECQTNYLAPIALTTLDVCENKKWCKTRSGKIVSPCKTHCLNYWKVPVTDKCELKEGIITIRSTINECSIDDLSHLTNFLYQTEDEITPDNLTNLSMMINKQGFNVTALDFYLIAEILYNVSNNFNKAEYKQPFFNVVNNLLDVNRSFLQNRWNYGFEHSISKSINNFFIDSYKENKSFSLNMTNVVIKVIQPTKSNSNDHYNITLDGVLIKIPNEILNTLTLTIFNANEQSFENNITRKVVNLTIMGVNEPLKKPISIYLQANSSMNLVCTFFNRNWWSKNVKTIILSDDLVECQTNYLGAISLLTLNICENKKWCKTPSGKIVFPCKTRCSDHSGNPVTETCELMDYFVTIQSTINECSNNDLSHLTNFLYQIEDEITPDNLKNLSTMINSQGFNVTALDFYLIAEILNFTSYYFPKKEYKQPFLDIVNNLFNINQSNFETELKSTNIILESKHKFLIDLFKETKSFTIDMSNIAIKIIEPNVPNFNEHYNTTLDGVLIKFSKEILNPLILTVFKTNHLLPDYNVISKIANISTMHKIESLILNNSISIYFRTNSSVQVACSYSYWWDSSFEDGIVVIEPVKTIRHSDDLVECQSKDLGTFVLLEAQFCLEENTDDKIPHTWCRSRVGRTVLPCKNPCIDQMGVPVTRTCTQLNYEVYWSIPKQSCSIINLSYFTKFYNEIQFHKITPTNLTDVAKMINNSSLTVVDIHSIARILNYTSHQNRKTELTPFFDILHNLQNVNKSLLKSAHEFGSTNNILQAVDKFLNELSKENTSLIIDKPNFIVQIIKSNSWNNITSQKVFVNIPKDILKTSILTIFKTNHLFPQNNVESKIIDLKITDLKGILNNPISIYLQVDPLIEVECAFWKILDEDIGYWSNKGVKTTRLNDNLVECQANHLGAFALLKVSDEFCPEENTYGKINQTWCKTPVGRIAIPCKNPCLNNNHPVHRKCEKINGVSKWLEIESECSDNGLSPFTNFTNDVKIDQITPNNLTDVAKIINNKNSSLTIIDVDQIAEILNYTSNQDKKTELAEPFFDIINNLLKVNQSLFKEAKEFGSIDKTLKSIDKFTIDLSKEKKSISINKPNVAIKIIEPNSNSDFYKINLPKISIKIPNDILNTTILTVFKNNNLFPEGNVKSDVINLKITSVERNLINPISIYLEVDSCENVECSFWDFNDKKIGNWSTDGVKTIRVNDTHIECQTNHLTAFVFLGISDRIKLSSTNQLNLHIITSVLCTLSLIGLIVVFITCIVLKKWYVKRIYTIQLSSVITLEIFMLFLNDVLIIDGLECLYFGILMHYLLLVKFMIMLIIAKMQYENYVSLFQSRYKYEQSYYITFITFSLPILIVGISAGTYSEHYNSSNIHFCYPKAEAFKYFLIIPIGLILLGNIIIFSVVMFKISKSMSRNTKRKILQAKLAVMLFFTLGLTWIFSVFSHIICTRWIQLIFIYVFSILSPLQGFAIFIFSIVLDVDAKNFWLDFCNRFKYSPLNRHINTTTPFALISEVTSDNLQNEISLNETSQNQTSQNQTSQNEISQNQTSQNQTLQTFNNNDEHNQQENNEGRIRRYLRRFGWKYF